VPFPQVVFAFTIAVTVVNRYRNAFFGILVSCAIQCFEDPTATMAETNAQRSQRRAYEGSIVETGVPRDKFASDPSLGGSAGFPLWYRLLCCQKNGRSGCWTKQEESMKNISHVAGRWSSGWLGSIHTNNKVDHQGNFRS
jgi:hypothetical protein